MGIAKQMLIEQLERGFGSIDKKVCRDCVHDYALKNYICINGFEDECSYCAELNVCVDVEDLLGEIMDGVRYEYDEAVNVMGWDDGEYVGAPTWDTYDLFDNILVGEIDDNLLEDILQTVELTTWCEEDPYQLRLSQKHLYMWNAFCHLVRKKIRYVFFRMPAQDDYNEESKYRILDHIGDAVRNLELIDTLAAGTRFRRGRMHNSQSSYNKAKDLCSPPHNKAKANRMSAEGISIFYGANDERTTISEIYNSRYKYATVGTFTNLREIKIVNLTKLQHIRLPSLFDKGKREYREPIRFLKELDNDLTRPIESMEAIEYIPAQIVAEYFRFLYKCNNERIDGIAYRSSKIDNGICYALFFDYEQCLNPNRVLNLEGATRYKVTANMHFEPS